jgi:hypothetical protein
LAYPKSSASGGIVPGLCKSRRHPYRGFALLALAGRKQKLHGLVPTNGERLLYCDHVEGMGEELFDLACQGDLEGIVAKRKFDPYVLDGSSVWLKIRNRNYSQWVEREELFERERHRDPWRDGILAPWLALD